MNAIEGALNIMAKAVNRTIDPEEPAYRPCDGCGGLGEFPTISACCGATRDPIRGTCQECKDDSDGVVCDVCNGTGKVIVTDEELEAEAFFSRVDNFRNE